MAHHHRFWNIARTVAVRVAIGLVLFGLAYELSGFRRHVIQQFFHDANHRAPPPSLATPDPMPHPNGLAPTLRTRVVLLDGVGLSASRALPHYNRVCADGLDIEIDTGFPTVSLPVQHALWTGITQQQAGILFRTKSLPTPPVHAIPPRVPDSRAIAESHQYIVASFGFHVTQPPGTKKTDIPEDWPDRFPEVAQQTVLGDAPLVFVHVLRADVAGHRHGADSDAYRQAIAEADTLLGALYDADRAAHPTRTRWFVLSDHGHRPGGGHGGAETWIRTVRGCIAGALGRHPEVSAGARVHLIDISRAIADSVGVHLSPDAVGRRLYAATSAPHDPTATLPSPRAWQFALAALAVLLGLALTGYAARASIAHLPWWIAIAVASVLVIEAIPTMSQPMVYRPRGTIVQTAAIPGFIALASTCTWMLWRRAPWRALAAQLILPMTLAIACLILSSGSRLLVDLITLQWIHVPGDPPLMPIWTAMTSVSLVLAFTGVAVVGLVVLASAVPAAFGRGVAAQP